VSVAMGRGGGGHVASEAVALGGRDPGFGTSAEGNEFVTCALFSALTLEVRADRI
jgi:hypothetical protein